MYWDGADCGLGDYGGAGDFGGGDCGFQTADEEASKYS